MKTFNRLEEIEQPFKNAAITIGNFDGVHIGHQALFHEVVERAEAISGTSVAMTFEPHPLTVLTQNGRPPLITLYEQKKELIEKTGIDVLITIPFTKEFAEVTAKTFVKEILIETIGMKVLVVGGDYAFGKNREGNTQYLQKAAETYGFHLIVSPWVDTPNDLADRISSTRIRELVEQGDVERAKNLLGRYYQIRGQVETGRDRGGKILGIPTANIALQDELTPKMGVYAVMVNYKDRLLKGVANIGFSPTFSDGQYTVEVHILDFNENIYGEHIRVNFISRIRDEKKFSGLEELQNQIHADIQYAQEILSARNP